MTSPSGYSGSPNNIASLACIASTLPESSSFTFRSKPAACAVSGHAPARTLATSVAALESARRPRLQGSLKRLSQIWRG